MQLLIEEMQYINGEMQIKERNSELNSTIPTWYRF